MKNKWWRFFFPCMFSLFTSSAVYADLKVGVMFYDPPLVISATQGFHVDIAQKICQGIHEKCVIVPMVWAKLFDALDKGDIDVIMGVFPTAERAQKYIFSIPYMVSQGSIIVLTKSGIAAYEKLKGLTVGIIREESASGGVFMDYIRSAFPDWFKVEEYKDIETLLLALRDDSVQAALMHSTAANYWVANSEGLFSQLGTSFNLGGGYTMMTLPDKQALITRINQVIQQLKADGEFSDLYKMYFNADISSK